MDLGQVFTSPAVAKYMVSLLNISKVSSVLDPCFGSGAFIKACLDAGFKNLTGYEIDKYLYDSVKERYPDIRLFNSDYLQADEKEKYDAIIMNPPYIRQEKIDELSELGISKTSLRKNPIFTGLPLTANIYMYFIIKALEMLCHNGKLVVIFPSSWLKAKSGQSFEKIICGQAMIEKQIHITGDVFQKNAMVDVVILSVKKTRKSISKNIIYLSLSNNAVTPRVMQDQKKRLIEDPVPFNTYANVRRGLTTGANAFFINPPVKDGNGCLIKIVSSPKSINGYSTGSALTDKLLWLRGEKKSFPKDIQQYLDKCEKMIINTRKPKTLYSKVTGSRLWYELPEVDSAGILFSYFVRNDMKFIMNTANVLARDNFYIISPHIDKYLLFALLNNYYTFYQLELIGKKYGAGLLKLQRYDIEDLIFPDIAQISPYDKEKLINTAEEMISRNVDMISGITMILSKYMNYGHDEISENFKLIKQQRLEER